jgi:hypothetical protein
MLWKTSAPKMKRINRTSSPTDTKLGPEVGLGGSFTWPRIGYVEECPRGDLLAFNWMTAHPDITLRPASSVAETAPALSLRMDTAV